MTVHTAVTVSKRIDDQDLAKKIIELQTNVGKLSQGVHIAQLSAAPTQADFNNLLTVLQNAGLLSLT